MENTKPEAMINSLKTLFQEVAIYGLVLGISILLCFGLVLAINHANIKVEAKCTASGGQVFTRPGRISSCLHPAIQPF